MSKLEIPHFWHNASLYALQQIADAHVWNYIVLSDQHLSDEEYKRRSAALDARAAWLENKIAEKKAAGER